MSEILSQQDIQQLQKLNLIQSTIEAQIQKINYVYHGQFEDIQNEKDMTQEQKVNAFKKLKNALVKERTQSELSKALKEVKNVLNTSNKQLTSLTKQYEESIKEMEQIILAPVVAYEEEQNKKANYLKEIKDTIDAYIDSLRYSNPTQAELFSMNKFVMDISLNKEISSHFSKEIGVFQMLWQAATTLSQVTQKPLEEDELAQIDLIADTIPKPETMVVDVLKPLAKDLNERQTKLYEDFKNKVLANSLSDHSINTTMVMRLFIDLIKENNL